nr:MAG TPA: hypothetical protein [Caudoviricetes sp.]
MCFSIRGKKFTPVFFFCFKVLSFINHLLYLHKYYVQYV